MGYNKLAFSEVDDGLKNRAGECIGRFKIRSGKAVPDCLALVERVSQRGKEDCSK